MFHRYTQIALGSLFILLSIFSLPSIERANAQTGNLLSLKMAQTYALADFNQDGFTDAAVADFQADVVHVLVGNRAGAFHTASSLRSDSGPRAVVAIDFNRDGAVDLAAANFFSGRIAIYEGLGDGGFEHRREVKLGDGLSSIIEGDFNSDGLPDLAVANFLSGEVVILKGSADWSFATPALVGKVPGVTLILSGDQNGDGVKDLFAFDVTGREARLFAGDSNGAFREAGNVDSMVALPSVSQDESRAIKKMYGDGQAATIGSSLPQPLVVDVTERDEMQKGRNPVVFSKLYGDARFEADDPQMVDERGRASLALSFRELPGNNLIAATVGGQVAVFSELAIFSHKSFFGKIRESLDQLPLAQSRLWNQRTLLDEAEDRLGAGDEVGVVTKLRGYVELLTDRNGSLRLISDQVGLTRSFLNQVLLVGLASSASQAEVINCGEPKTNRQISSPAQIDTYTFSANAGEAVIFAAAGTSGGVCAKADLYDPSDAPIGGNIFCNGASNSISLQTTGVYTIRVYDSGLNDIGAYDLSLQFATGRCGTPTACGQTKSKTTVSKAQLETYTFSSNAGESVIFAATSPGALCAKADLYSPTGVLVQGNIFCDGSSNSIQLSTAGTYTILVYDSGLNDTGSYDFHLQFTTGQCGVSIDCGKTRSGNITSNSQLDAYNFSGNVGEAVIFAAANTSGTVCAKADLYSPTGTLIQGNVFCNGASNSITLPTTGIYTILVYDSGLNDTGFYDLHLQFTTGRCGKTTACGRMENGTTTSKVQLDAYTFCGADGSSVVFSAVGPDALCAKADLYGPTGALIQGNVFCDGSSNSIPLAATGTYTILVYDSGLNDTGSYSASLSCAGNICPSPLLAFAVGTFSDRRAGIIGTAFLLDPVTIAGAVSSTEVQGPSGWNGNNPFRFSTYQPPMTASTRAFSWHFTTPLTGSYTARASVGSQTFQGEARLNASSALEAPQITNTSITPGQVVTTWSASTAVQSFLVRLSPIPFTSPIREMVVSGDARTATFTGFSLANGSNYRIDVFAFSSDLKTPGPFPTQFNISIDSTTFQLSVSTRKIYVLKGGHKDSDQAVIDTLRGCGWNVTEGDETPKWDGSQANLNDFDAVVILHNANWAEPLPAAGAQAIRDYIRQGGGVVTSEWFTYGIFFGSPLLPLSPVGEYCGWNNASTTTYTQVTPDPVINNGLPTSFSFSLSSFAGTESCFVTKSGATVFYSSSNGGGRPGSPGLLGWNVENGRIISFSTLAGKTELENANYAQLLCNTDAWVARRSDFAAAGRVTTSDGRPLADAELAFTRISGNGSLPDPVRTDPNGNWRQTGFQSRTSYRVLARRPGYSFTPTSRDFSGESAGLDFVGAHPISLTVRALCGGGSELTADVRITPGGDFNTPVNRSYELGQTVRLDATGAVIGQCGLLTVMPSFHRWRINGNPQAVGQRIVDLKLDQDTEAIAEFVIGGTPPSYKLSGLDFNPYIDGQDPNDGVVVSEEQLRARMAIIARYPDRIRTFGCTNGLEKAGRIAREFGLKAAIGAWLSDNLAANEREIANLIAVAQAGEADLLIVGSEVLLRRNQPGQQLTEQQLLDYINRVNQAAPGIPVTTADVYSEILAHPKITAAVDVVMINIYGYWEDIRVDTAMAALHYQYQRVVAAAGGKTVIISETGWPSCGATRDKAVPSPVNASFYFLNFVSWARANNIPYFYFSAFDESWKARYEGPQGACWGIWDKDGNLKPGMQRVFDGETTPDNWTLPGGPGQPRVELTDVSAYGSSDDLKGQVWHLKPEDHKVAVYIRVGSGWWTKPTFAQPLTTIQPSGRWVCDIVTGGSDQLANRIAVFVLPNGYNPPLMSGGMTLPSELDQNAVAKIEVARAP